VAPFTPNPWHLDEIAKELPGLREAILRISARAPDPTQLTERDWAEMKDIAAKLEHNAKFLQGDAEMLRSPDGPPPPPVGQS
jgi:hypothetical protein